MSRSRRAAAVSDRSQNESGITINSLARPGISLPVPPRGGGFCALMRRDRLRAYIPKRDTAAVWAVLRDSVTLIGMRSAGGTHAADCPSCRGIDWKVRRSRRALVVGTVVRGTADAARFTCLDCGGAGHTARA